MPRKIKLHRQIVYWVGQMKSLIYSIQRTKYFHLFVEYRTDKKKVGVREEKRSSLFFLHSLLWFLLSSPACKISLQSRSFWMIKSGQTYYLDSFKETSIYSSDNCVIWDRKHVCPISFLSTIIYITHSWFNTAKKACQGHSEIEVCRELTSVQDAPVG